MREEGDPKWRRWDNPSPGPMPTGLRREMPPSRGRCFLQRTSKPPGSPRGGGRRKTAGRRGGGSVHPSTWSSPGSPMNCRWMVVDLSVARIALAVGRDVNSRAHPRTAEKGARVCWACTASPLTRAASGGRRDARTAPRERSTWRRSLFTQIGGGPDAVVPVDRDRPAPHLRGEPQARRTSSRSAREASGRGGSGCSRC